MPACPCWEQWNLLNSMLHCHEGVFLTVDKGGMSKLEKAQISLHIHALEYKTFFLAS